MALFEMVMPKMGESIMEATVLKWLKKPGDRIDQDESLLEIATDKVDSEVPALSGGVVKEILAQEGQTVPVGSVIALIQVEGEATSSGAVPAAPVEKAIVEEVHKTVMQAQAAVAPAISAVSSNGAAGRFYSPLVLSIAKEEGISMSELEALPGSGSEGRVTKKDILAYVRNRPAGGVIVAPNPVMPEPVATPAVQVSTVVSPVSAPAQKTFSFSGEYEIIEMDRMRKLIAENMVYSKHTSPHVTSFVEADVTNLVLWREKNKSVFEKKYGEKLTFTPLFIDALVRAIREFPLINISVEGDKILVKKNVNIGMAVALPSGNLIVPVIKNADRLNLVGLTASVNDLANRARNNKLVPDDLANGTYTLTNVGTFGNVMGTPVILQPQVAIMAAGAIRKKPAVIETPSGDFIGIRQMMFLSHSYDHRVVDGALGGSFVRKVADFLENWDINKEV
jgi:2-oxoglutarate dehydrogenase E2 component (dihydrolipoamide succinyltransferase)